MKAGSRAVFLACALAALLALPAAAAAKPGYKVRPGGSQLTMWAEEKKGYEFTVSANKRQRVQLSVEKEVFSTTAYSTKGRVSSRRVEADLGGFGRIDVEIDLAPSRSGSRKGSQSCKGKPPLFLYGTFRGAIEFSGEGRVPAISTKRGPVLFTRRFRQVCKRRRQQKQNEDKQGGEKQPPAIEVGGLRAQAKGEGRTILFEAFSLAPPRNPALSLGIAAGSAYERREGVRIVRTAFELFGSGLLMSKRDKEPETFRVKLEEPFTGRGLYSHSAASPPTWTGNLSVTLPGIDPIPLAGPGFSFDFCRDLSFARVARCLYGSGSHSQPLALAKLSSLR
jgi:hypothetical protein